MTNARFARIDQFRDIETLGHYAEQIAAGVSPAAFIAGANENGRDNSRTPMQWTSGPNAGFTEGTPWIEVNPNHETINVADDRADPRGLIAHYRRLIALRKELPAVVFGRFRPVAPEHPAIYAYTREWEGERIAVLANWSGAPVDFDVPEALAIEGTCLIANCSARTRLSGRVSLEPWEAFAIHQA